MGAVSCSVYVEIHSVTMTRTYLMQPCGSGTISFLPVVDHMVMQCSHGGLSDALTPFFSISVPVPESALNISGGGETNFKAAIELERIVE
jgi:hypothetical protein